MKKITIFIFILVLILGNVVYADDINYEEIFSEQLVNHRYDDYMIIRVKSTGVIYMFILDEEMLDNDEIRLIREYGREHIREKNYYVYKNGEVTYREGGNGLLIFEDEYGNINYDVLYATRDIVSSDGRVFFSLKTLLEITGESVEEIPGMMAGTMKKIFPAGFGILLGIGLVRSLKVLYRYF